MIIQFIGTGSGKTSPNRYHSSILLTYRNSVCLIDCGDGISRALIEQNIGMNNITSIIITHLHPDHFSGLLTLLVNMRLTGRSKSLNIYVHHKQILFLDSVLKQTNLEGIKKYFSINLIGILTGKVIMIDDSIEIIAEQNEHISNNQIAGHDVFYSISMLINSETKSIFYTSDIGSDKDLLLFRNYKIDYLICETTHIPFESIIKTAEAFNYSNVILTHIDENDEKNLSASLAKWNFKIDISMAFDGLKIKI